ncbi:MAG: Ig-like domain-containing protein [Marinobacter sp.]|nr:Ig-like domain-containing protein [Marinobacter sp.]
MKRFTLILCLVAALVACGGDQAEIGPNPSAQARSQSLVYAYPAHQQQRVPLSAPVVLRFSSAVVSEQPEQIIQWLDADDHALDFSVTLADEGRSLMLAPGSRLQPGAAYRVVLDGLMLAKGPVQPRTLTFETAYLTSGPISQVASDSSFHVEHRFPDGDFFPILDFSSLRLQFSQPLDRRSLSYGDNLRLSGPDGLVPAEVLVSGHYLTLDPRQELTPGATYTLSLGDTLTSTLGVDMAATEYTFVPRSSGGRSTLVQQVPDANSGQRLSILTGEPINQVPLQAVLLGDDNSTQQTGDIYAELAHIPTFPTVTPLRVKRGSLLQGSPLELLIGGEVPAGFGSGEIEIRFISDAMGYLLENPFSRQPDAPRHLVLYMDIAISAQDPRANGAVTQNILHLQLNGTAVVEDGQMVINAIGVAEPRLLGLESARSLLSFYMASYPDQRNAPLPPQDQTAPQLLSWLPGAEAERYRPTDPLIFNFSEPLIPGSIRAGDNALLLVDDEPVAFHSHVDGAALVITPVESLPYGSEVEWVMFDGVTDLAGNPASAEIFAFQVPALAEGPAHAPVILSTYPGFPCPTQSRDLAADNAGRCIGGLATDDHLPLARLPADRLLHMVFSRELDPASVTPETLQVHRVDDQGEPLEVVAGHLALRGRTLTFAPAEPWQPGTLYRYRLHSVLDNPDCGVNALCDRDGLPLKTMVLALSPAQAFAPTQGGPNLDIFFRGAAEVTDVLQQLANLPTADVNANFVADPGEPRFSDHPDGLENTARLVRNPAANPLNDGTSASGNAVDDANVGCGFTEDEPPVPLVCDDQQYLHMNGILHADVVGFRASHELDPSDPTIPALVQQQGGVLVYIYPTQMFLSGTVVHVETSDAVKMLSFVAQPVDTGPQVMRIRAACDAAIVGSCDAHQGRIPAWIVEQGGEPQLLVSLDLYLDAPWLDPVVENFNILNPDGSPTLLPVSHDLRSYPLSLSLAGGVSFLPDGRLAIQQVSLNDLALSINLQLGSPPILTADLYLAIPAGEVRLVYVSEPVKQ